MIELLGAVLGAATGLIIIRLFDKYRISKGQENLESTVNKNENTIARIEGQQEQEDKQAKDKINEIEREKKTKPSRSKLVDFFLNRK